MKARSVALLALGMSLRSPDALAQNYREMPIGGRTATMGGAGTAAGNDSAMPYLNPAGLAGVPGDIFAVSATVYSYTHRSFENFFFPRGTPAAFGYAKDSESFSTSSVGELPSSVMYFRHLNPTTDPVHHHLGMSLIIPSARNVDIVANLTGRLTSAAGNATQTTSIQTQSRDYYLGPTYAVGIGKHVRVGLSMYALYQRASLSYGRTVDLRLLGGSEGARFTQETASKLQTFSLAPIAGVQARLVSDLWVGLGVAAPTIGLGGRLESNQREGGTTISGGREVPTSSLSTLDVEAQRAKPLRLNAGLAWQRPKSFSAAADIHLYFARTTQEVRGSAATEEQRSGDLARRYRRGASSTSDSDAVVDVSLGGEYAVTETVAVRAGFFTDLASSAELTSRASDYSQIRLNRFGGTLGLGLKVGSFDTTAGVILARGSGKYGAQDLSLQSNTPTVVPVESTETTGMLVLSGAVTVEEAKKLIRDTVPVAVPLPDLELGNEGRPPAPWIPEPLPAEDKPPPPRLRRGPPEMIAPPPPVRP